MKQAKTDTTEGFRILAGNHRAQAAKMVLAPEESTGGPGNKHENSDQWLYVISGEGKAIIGGTDVSISPGLLTLIEAGETHEIRNTGEVPLETINFYCPPEY